MIEWWIFVPACFALNLAFGPNNLLAMTNGARAGVVFALWAAFGRLIMFAPMIALSALGLGLVLTTSALVFAVAKLVGAIYLIWLGISLWRSAKTLRAEDFSGGSKSLYRAFKAEAFVAVSNPKAILIFAAFFPQFVVIDAYWSSFALLGGAFLAMEVVAILTYAMIGRLASKFASGKLPIMQRVSGATMCVFGLLLLISPQPTRA